MGDRAVAQPAVVERKLARKESKTVSILFALHP